MISRAILRFQRISPRKTRLVADVIRGKSIDAAQAILMNMEKKGRIYIGDVLKSAIGNAVSANPQINPGDLYISKITIDGGPMFKRYRAGSMGRAMMIKHRTSHIAIELDVKKEALKKITEAESKKSEKIKTKKIEAKTAKEAKTKAKKLVAAGKKGK